MTHRTGYLFPLSFCIDLLCPWRHAAGHVSCQVGLSLLFSFLKCVFLVNPFHLPSLLHTCEQSRGVSHFASSLTSIRCMCSLCTEHLHFTWQHNYSFPFFCNSSHFNHTFCAIITQKHQTEIHLPRLCFYPVDSELCFPLSVSRKTHLIRISHNNHRGVHPVERFEDTFLAM